MPNDSNRIMHRDPGILPYLQLQQSSEPLPAAAAADTGLSSSNFVAGNRGPNSAVALAPAATAWHLAQVGPVMVPPRLLTPADAAFQDAEIFRVLTLLRRSYPYAHKVLPGEQGGHKFDYQFSESTVATLYLDRDHWLRELVLETQEANGNTTRDAVQFQPRSSATLQPSAPSLPAGSQVDSSVAAGRKRQNSPPLTPSAASRLRTEAGIRHVLGLGSSSQWDGNRGGQPTSLPSPSVFTGAFGPSQTSPVQLTPRSGGEPTVPAGTSNLPQRSGIQSRPRILGVPDKEEELIKQYKEMVDNPNTGSTQATALRNLASWLASNKRGGLAELAELNDAAVMKALEECAQASYPKHKSLDSSLKTAFKGFQGWQQTGKVSLSVAHPRIQDVPDEDEKLIKQYKEEISNKNTRKNHATALRNLASWLASNKRGGLAELAKLNDAAAMKTLEECLRAYPENKSRNSKLKTVFKGFQKWRDPSRPALSSSFWRAADREGGQENTSYDARGAGPQMPFAIHSRPRPSFGEEVVGSQWQHGIRSAPDNLARELLGLWAAGLDITSINILGMRYSVVAMNGRMEPTTANPHGLQFLLYPSLQGG